MALTATKVRRWHNSSVEKNVYIPFQHLWFEGGNYGLFYIFVDSGGLEREIVMF